MIVFKAPRQAPQTTILLPNPQFDDTENLSASISLQRAMDNTIYTTVKSGGLRKLKYKFQLFRDKALELEAFLNSYMTADIIMESYKHEVWFLNFINDPFEFAFIGRDNYIEISLEMEGFRQEVEYTRSVSDSLQPSLWDHVVEQELITNHWFQSNFFASNWFGGKWWKL